MKNATNDLARTSLQKDLTWIEQTLEDMEKMSPRKQFQLERKNLKPHEKALGDVLVGVHNAFDWLDKKIKQKKVSLGATN